VEGNKDDYNIGAAEETIGYKKVQKRKSWITDRTFEVIKAKREARLKDKD
jgi:hypothetical protein